MTIKGDSSEYELLTEAVKSSYKLKTNDYYLKYRKVLYIAQVGHNRTSNFSDYLRFFLENSDFLRLSEIFINLSSKKR